MIDIHAYRRSVSAHLGEVLTPDVAAWIEAQARLGSDARAQLTGFRLADGATTRDHVEALEERLLALPQEQQTQFKTTHALSGGVYARTIFIPAGSRLVGAVHNKDHINVLVGDISVLTDDGAARLTGFHVLPTGAGMKRAGYAHADTTWTSLIRTDLTDLEAIEDEITPESEKLQTRRLGIAYAKLEVLPCP